MLIETTNKIAIDDMIRLVEEQHGKHGLRYLGYRSLQILCNEHDIHIAPAVAMWLDELKTRKL